MKNYTSEVLIDRLGSRRASREQLIKNLGTGMLGKSHSEETKRKIGEANRGRMPSAETRAKMSRARKGTQMGPSHPNWKGGEWVNKEGRVYVYRPDHPHANNKGYVFRARLVMESVLGRYLEPEETVHHRNEITNDDRPENLQLFPSRGEHTAFHNTGKDRSGSRLPAHEIFAGAKERS
jgi:hypothetical protein